MARIGIVGAGAIGGWIAARLSMVGHDVGILTRGATANEYAGGLTLVEGGTETRASVNASPRAEDLGEQDMLIVSVKAFALPEAAPASRPMVGPDTLIVPMMNGVPWWFTPDPLAAVDPENRIAPAYPLDQVIGGVVHAACRRESRTRIVVQKADHLLLGEIAGGESERVAHAALIFSEAGIVARQSSDIRRAIWYKLWGNMTMNPISALTLAPADRIIAQCRDLKAAAMEEARAIGAAIGCAIDETAADRIAVAEKLGSFKTSMLQDVEAGRRLELDAILGAPLELARRHGIATPNLDALYALTRLMAESRGLA